MISSLPVQPIERPDRFGLSLVDAHRAPVLLVAERHMAIFGVKRGFNVSTIGKPHEYFDLCLLFIHPRAPNLINLLSASTMLA